MARLRILFLPTWYPPEAAPFIEEHAKAASLYNDVTVIYVHHGPYQQAKGRYQIFEDGEEGIRTLRVKWRQSPIPRTSFLFRLRGLGACFRKLIKEGWKPDVIHAHVFPSGVPAVILGRLHRIPVVITEHWSRFPLREMTWLDRMKARFAMNRAARVIPVSDFLRRHIESYGVRSKFSVVPNTFDTRFFYPSFPSAEQKGVMRRILAVTRLTPEKGISYLLEALAWLKRDKGRCFTLDILGDGASKGEYEQQARSLGLNDVVQFHGGWKPKEEVAEFMRSCDFLVHPSLGETFGVVCIEAMACGKPVIATSCGGPQEIINSENGILVPPADAEALAQAIEFMVDNCSRYSPERIAQHSRERFSYETVGKMLDEIYHEVIGTSD